MAKSYLRDTEIESIPAKPTLRDPSKLGDRSSRRGRSRAVEEGKACEGGEGWLRLPPPPPPPTCLIMHAFACASASNACRAARPASRPIGQLGLELAAGRAAGDRARRRARGAEGAGNPGGFLRCAWEKPVSKFVDLDWLEDSCKDERSRPMPAPLCVIPNPGRKEGHARFCDCRAKIALAISAVGALSRTGWRPSVAVSDSTRAAGWLRGEAQELCWIIRSIAS